MDASTIQHEEGESATRSYGPIDDRDQIPRTRITWRLAVQRSCATRNKRPQGSSLRLTMRHSLACLLTSDNFRLSEARSWVSASG